MPRDKDDVTSPDEALRSWEKIVEWVMAVNVAGRRRNLKVRI